MNVIVAEGVSRTYGDTVALAGVSLSVGAGEVFALVGPNGAGKTTLVRALTGTTDSEGSVEVFGTPPRAIDRERIGLLPQSFSPPDRLTPRELLSYYGGLYDEARPTEELLREVGMEDSADTYYENLSGGQQRRTCVAATLVNDPELLVLDEPTTGIDPAGRRSLHRLIEGLAASGTTVFLTSHAMDEVERLADRVALLRDGAVVAVGKPDALVDEHAGDPRLEVTLDGALDDTTLDSVREAANTEVVTTEDGLRFVGVRPEGIADAVSTLERVGITFESLTWEEPSLEDVYLRLTGETYSPRSDGGAVAVGGESVQETDGFETTSDPEAAEAAETAENAPDHEEVRDR